MARVTHDIHTAGGTSLQIKVHRSCVDAMLEDVTGQANQNPSEYVSVGLLSTPWHGAGVDGVKYFATENGNTVASGVVTEATGAAITGIDGLLMEPQRVNYANSTDDLSGGADTIDLTAAGTGDYTLSVSSTAAVTVAAGTATGTGFGQSTDGSPVTFNLSVAGSVTLTLDSGSLDTFTSGNAAYNLEKGDSATSFIENVTTSTTRNIDALSYSGIAADNETRAVVDGADVDVDDWDGVVDATLLGADDAGVVESITVYTTGERPA